MCPVLDRRVHGEGGGLTLRSNDVDVSARAIADLKKSILEFDALISGEPGVRDEPIRP